MSSSDTNTTSNTEEQEPAKEEDSEKKARIDKLWDGFKKDVGDPKVSKNAAVVTRPSEAHTSSTQQVSHNVIFIVRYCSMCMI